MNCSMPTMEACRLSHSDQLSPSQCAVHRPDPTNVDLTKLILSCCLIHLWIINILYLLRTRLRAPVASLAPRSVGSVSDQPYSEWRS